MRTEEQNIGAHWGWFGDPVKTPKDSLKRIFLAFHPEDLNKELVGCYQVCLQSNRNAFASDNARERLHLFVGSFPGLIEALYSFSCRSTKVAGKADFTTSLQDFFQSLVPNSPEQIIWELLDACATYTCGHALSDQSSLVPFCKALLDLVSVARTIIATSSK